MYCHPISIKINFNEIQYTHCLNFIYNVQSQENAQPYEGVEWDSFDMDEDSKGEEERESPKPLTAFKSRERSVSPVRQPRDAKAPGSIGKLKISSEMRAKLELVTINHTARPSGAGPGESNGGRGGEGTGVRKLEDNRRLMLQQQLGGRKWDTVEEVERITRRASSEDRADLIKAVHQRTPVCFLTARSLFFCVPVRLINFNVRLFFKFYFHPSRPTRWRGLVAAVISRHRTRDRLSSKRQSNARHRHRRPTIRCSKFNITI